MSMWRSWALSGAIALLAVMTVAAQAPAGGQGGRAGGQGPGAAGGLGPGFGGKTPTALRAIAAETTAAKVKDPHWRAPKTAWGHPDLAGVWTSDDMRSVQMSRAPQYGTRESLTADEFTRRASGDEGSRDRAVNQETILRNEFGVRTFGYTSFVVDPPNGQLPAMTPAGRARAANRDAGTFGPGPFDTFEDFTLYDRCITRGIVGSVLPVPYGNGNRIVQAPGLVVISYEMVHDTRVIYTDGRPHVGQGLRQYLGDSRGRWDGNTLIVETTNLTDKTSIGANGNGLRHSADMKMTERITRVGHDVLQYEITVEDPKTYAKPFTISMPLTPLRGDVLLPYECHEGNYGLPNALSAERAEDRAIEEDRKNGIIRARRAIQVAVPNRPEAPAVEGAPER